MWRVMTREDSKVILVIQTAKLMAVSGLIRRTPGWLDERERTLSHEQPEMIQWCCASQAVSLLC